ncbi:MAG TPA: hypothetical protein VLN45_05535, partial [Ignavibacteriaceae bacterium]|nr:hypothetical protein [Ignavibacteriaceae bacterium]
VVYKSDPVKNPNSTDILDIVAKDNVLITENTANKTNGINIHASIFCENGGFGAGWKNFLVPCGKINLLGGIQNKSRVQIGETNGNGFSRAYKYDKRLALISPPYYPGTGKFEIVSWKE